MRRHESGESSRQPVNGRNELPHRTQGPRSQYYHVRRRIINESEYLKPNTMAFVSQVNNFDCNRFKKSFKSSYRGNYQFRKSWHGKTDLVHEQLNGEFFHRNEQLKNNFGRRSFPSSFLRKNYGRTDNNYRNSSWVLKESPNGWYGIYIKINVEECAEVIKVIQHYIKPAQFYPYNIHLLNSKNTLVFAVDDFKIAKLLHNINGRIMFQDQNLRINVKHYRGRFYCTSVSSEVREKIAQEIANRYNPDTKCLDLSHFHTCQSFTDNQWFLPLNQPLFLMAVLKIGADYVKHDLYGLSLKNNHIYLGDGLVWIRRLFPELKILDLSDNKLTNVEDLESLSGFAIEELNLFKNPVNNTEYQMHYKQEVQKMFPVLKKLDNTELESRYSVIVDLKLKMPINLDNSYPIPKGHNCKEPNPVISFIELFLSQYFERYDNKVSRHLVEEAYHDNSIYSLSSIKQLNFSKGDISEYTSKSRNLFTFTRKNIGYRFLHRGKNNIVNFLKKLPKTKHDLGSFQIDVPLVNSTMAQVVVNGTFAENFEESNSRHVFRSFCRTFCIVPNGSNWLIISDMLFVSTASNEIMLESVKRFNASKPSNKNNFNGNDMDHMGMFMDDAEKIYDMKSSSSNNSLFSSQKITFPVSENSQKSSFYLCSSSPQNQQIASQDHVTPTAVMTVPWKEQKSNSMPAPNLKTTNPSASTIPCSSIVMDSPSSPTYETSSASMTCELEQLKSNAVSNTLLNKTLPLPLSSPSSPTNSQIDELTMIKNFSSETGMNDRWTKKCLKENGWNYSKALISFSRLKSSIPLIAFKH